MTEILKTIELIEDKRQEKKVRHKLLDVVVIVLFAKLANADDWQEVEIFAKSNEDFLRQYIFLVFGFAASHGFSVNTDDFFECFPFIAVYNLIPFLINTLHIFRCNAPHNPLHCVMLPDVVVIVLFAKLANADD